MSIIDTNSSVIVSEIFYSLQGESSLAGLPFSFIRLTGCDLRCNYCDTTYAFQGGKKMALSEIIHLIRPHQTKHVLITGGEPLLQPATPALVDLFNQSHYHVSIETHGETQGKNSLQCVSGKAKLIMDIKTPSSGMCHERFRENLKWLTPQDEIKFVIASQADYLWAKKILQTDKLPPVQEILFSPALPPHATQSTLRSYEGVTAKWLAEQILNDHLPVRFQLQLHKLIWGPDQRGV